MSQEWILLPQTIIHSWLWWHAQPCLSSQSQPHSITMLQTSTPKFHTSLFCPFIPWVFKWWWRGVWICQKGKRRIEPKKRWKTGKERRRSHEAEKMSEATTMCTRALHQLPKHTLIVLNMHMSSPPTHYGHPCPQAYISIHNNISSFKKEKTHFGSKYCGVT